MNITATTYLVGTSVAFTRGKLEGKVGYIVGDTGEGTICRYEILLEHEVPGFGLIACDSGANFVPVSEYSGGS